MQDINGFTITEVLDESNTFITYRGVRVTDGQQVMLKTFTADYPSLDAIAMLRHEYDMTRALDVDGVIRVGALEKHRNGLLLIKEDFFGAPLISALQDQRLDLGGRLYFSIEIVKILEALHKRRVVHNNLNAYSIYINISERQAKLTNLSMASADVAEGALDEQVALAGERLAYIAPEQTGRVNRSIDFRSDLYALGITLFEMFTGRVPFVSADQMELVYSHIARVPQAPHELNPGLPTTLSNIILRLLAKSADDRYQSAYGLRIDLETCWTQWQASGRIDSFAPGRHDISDRLRIPPTLYGREPERESLRAAFERVCVGGTEVIWISGHAGSGKSALAHDMRTSSTQGRSYFISGKFDQFQPSRPYSAIIHAFQELVQHILSEEAEQLAIWKVKLQNALGSLGQVIIDIIPEVELIIGAQPELLSLGPVESQNRFNLIFQKFVSAFLQREKPLVLFIDDLQWADIASLRLFKQLSTDPNFDYFLMIAAYRDNEVDHNIPLIDFFDTLGNSTTTITHIMLDGLGLAHTQKWIADILSTGEEKVKPLTETVYNKTYGNPFFVKEFMNRIYQDKILEFIDDHSVYPVSSIRARGEWHWDLNDVNTAQITDHVVDLMIDKIQKLDTETQSTLQLASCIGNTFDLKILSHICKKPFLDLIQTLSVAQQKGLVNIIENRVNSTMGISLNERENQASEKDLCLVSYKFTHDRIQQAAYSLINEERKESIHVEIGQMLINYSDEESSYVNIFDIVNHLNFGIELISDISERFRFAELNYEAGLSAIESGAYKSALVYFQSGLSFLPDSFWEYKYEFAFSLYKSLIECEYLTGDFDRAEHLFADLQAYARTKIDRVELYIIKIKVFSYFLKYQESIEVGREGLRVLGVELPSVPSRSQLLIEFMKFRRAQGLRRTEDLARFSRTMPREQEVAIEILVNMWGGTFLLNQWSLQGFIVLKMANMMLRYGYTAFGSMAYSCFGAYLSSVIGHGQPGSKYGLKLANLALRTAEKFDDTLLRGRVYFVYGSFFSHHQAHLATSIDYLREGITYCLQAGDILYAGYCSDLIMMTMPRVRYTLQEICTASEELQTLANHIGNQGCLYAIRIVHWWIDVLEKADTSCLPARYEVLDADQMTKMERRFYRLFEFQLAYLFEHYDQALAMLQRAGRREKADQGSYFANCFRFYHSLTLTALYADATPEERRGYWKTLKRNQRDVKRWAATCPANFLHKYLLVAAEMARLVGRYARAEALYDQAIASAQEHEYLQHAALANELTAKFHLGRANPHVAQSYLMEARHAYLRWGALAKVAALEAQYPQLCPQTLLTQRGEARPPALMASNWLDFQTALKAAQAISGEMMLEGLLTKLMRMVLENSGAQRGFLILGSSEALKIEAQGDLTQSDHIWVGPSCPLEMSSNLSIAIVHYVVRLQQSVVLHDATRQGPFVTDPYITRYQPQSVLCAPIMHQGHLSGVIYLENNSTTGAFTHDRLEVVRLLTSQAAIAIENASLYEHVAETNARLEEYNRTLEQRVEARTEDLREKNRELEAANEIIRTAAERKAQFFNGMSHELRAPLDAVIGFSEVLEEQTVGNLNTQQQEYVNYILSSGNHLLSLINNLLELSKIDAGMMPLQLSPVSLRPLLEGSLLMVQEQAATRRIRLTLEMDGQVNGVVGDELRIKQIMVNLLNNAVKFTLDHGSVGVRVMREGGHARVAVWDTGVGIAPEDTSRIFDEFQQVGQHRSGQIKGTGLGLALTKKFVELHGGTIDVESTLGEGSTFSFVLRLADTGLPSERF